MLLAAASFLHQLISILSWYLQIIKAKTASEVNDTTNKPDTIRRIWCSRSNHSKLELWNLLDPFGILHLKHCQTQRNKSVDPFSQPTGPIATKMQLRSTKRPHEPTHTLERNGWIKCLSHRVTQPYPPKQNTGWNKDLVKEWLEEAVRGDKRFSVESNQGAPYPKHHREDNKQCSTQKCARFCNPHPARTNEASGGCTFGTKCKVDMAACTWCTLPHNPP